MRHFLLYAVIRLGLWAVIWWALTLLGVGVALAGVLAALIAMLISILFLERLRNAAAMRWKAADERRAERRGADVDEDAEYEDALLDSEAEHDAAGSGAAGDSAADDSAADDGEQPAAGPARLPDVEEPGQGLPGPDGPDQVR